MTSVAPPTYYFNGITFNSAFYTTSSSGGLSQSQANALYLKKNTADTASALETFSAGIATNGINPTTTTGAIAIGTSSTSTTLAGAVSVSNALSTPAIDPVFSGGNFNIGNVTPSTINVGTASATAVNIGSSSALTTTNGALTATGLITANNGLTMGTGKNITLQPNTGYAAPSSGMLGFITTGTIGSSTLSAGGTCGSITLPNAGIYIVSYNFSFGYTTTVPNNLQTTLNAVTVGFCVLNSLLVNSSATQIINNATANTTYNVVYYYSSSVTSFAGPNYINAVRIA